MYDHTRKGAIWHQCDSGHRSAASTLAVQLHVHNREKKARHQEQKSCENEMNNLIKGVRNARHFSISNHWVIGKIT